MSKHTPGPWIVQYQTNVFGDDGERLVANTGGRQDNTTLDGGRGENIANALLISQAPAMYEALKAARQALATLKPNTLSHLTQTVDERFYEPHQRLLLQIDTALAKAGLVSDHPPTRQETDHVV